MFCYLSTPKEFDLLRKKQQQFAIYKFNPNGCRLSEETRKNLLPTIKAEQIKHVYLIDIIVHNDLSTHIADVTGIKHESPQLLIFEDGEVVADRSHMEITGDFLLSHLKG